MKNNPNVAITGLQAMANPDPGVAVARCLKYNGQKVNQVIGLSYSLHCTGNFTPFFDHIFLIPFPWDSQAQWLDRIQQIHHRIPLDIIIPTLDSEIVLFSQLSDTLSSLGIKTILPPETAVKTRTKNYLPEWCKKNSIPTPKTNIMVDKLEIEKIAGQIGYPCLLKGAVAGAHTAHDIYEASVFFDHIAYYWGLPVIAQERIKGDDFVVAALADHHSRMVGCIAMKKLCVTSAGKCSIGSIVENGKLVKLTEKIITSLQWVGPLEVELVYDAFAHEYYLIEINARFPAWIYLAGESHYNLPEKLVAMALGEKITPLPPCQSGLFYARGKEDYFFDGTSYSQLAAKGELIKGEILSESK